MPIFPISFGKGLNLSESQESLNEDIALFMNGIFNRNGHNQRRPGDTEYADTSSSFKINSMYWWDENNILIVVNEEAEIYTIDQSGTVTAITGSTLRSGRQVRFAGNDSVIYMANGTEIQKLNVGDSSVTQLSSSVLPQFISDLVILDNFLFAVELDSGRFYRSEPVVGAISPTFESDQVYTAESQSDYVERLVSIRGALYILGQRSLEIWQNQSDGSGIVRVSTAVGGIASPDTLAIYNDDFLYLNSNREISDSVGRIISEPIGPALADVVDISDAFSMLYLYDSKLMYIITFPSQDVTYAFDVKLQQWVQWAEFNEKTGVFSKWKAASYAYARKWNKHLIGHQSNGKVYVLDKSKYVSDSADLIVFKKQIHNISGGTLEVKTPRALIFRLLGNKGKVGSLDSPATVLVRYRMDNREWTQPITISLYEQGREAYVAVLRRLRPFRLMDLEITIADNAKIEWAGLQLDVELEEKYG